jgi:hypothetical protein
MTAQIKSLDKASPTQAAKEKLDKLQLTTRTKVPQTSGPKITHASRKRIIANSDGTVEEMEEVLETGNGVSAHTSKPVIIGVVPSSGIKTRATPSETVNEKSKKSQRSHQGIGPNVQEMSKTASSTLSSVSKKQTTSEPQADHPKGVQSGKKTVTTVQEEKTLSKQMAHNTRMVSGTYDEIAPIIKTEKIKYDPASVGSQQSPLPTKSVPVIATETRKVAYTESRPSNIPSFSRTSPVPTSSYITSPTPPPPPQFANDNSPGTTPTNSGDQPVGDIII